mmetsp:Transcript_8131/g.12754  ORF Transcript_8131/g.12754 Transcript_8131/m.12754 type:complete len:234 (+) Transcript_8131:530-1231(+)
MRSISSSARSRSLASAHLARSRLYVCAVGVKSYEGMRLSRPMTRGHAGGSNARCPRMSSVKTISSGLTTPLSKTSSKTFCARSILPAATQAPRQVVAASRSGSIPARPRLTSKSTAFAAALRRRQSISFFVTSCNTTWGSSPSNSPPPTTPSPPPASTTADTYTTGMEDTPRRDTPIAAALPNLGACFWKLRGAAVDAPPRPAHADTCLHADASLASAIAESFCFIFGSGRGR